MTESSNLCSVMFQTLQTVSTMLDVFFSVALLSCFLENDFAMSTTSVC